VIGSVKSYLAFSGDSPYSSSKFALRALCESISGEFAPYGISVTHVCPAYVATEIRLIDAEGVVREDFSDPVSPPLLMPADVTAKAIASAIVKRRSELVLTNYGKLVVFLKRHAPKLLAWILAIANIQVVARPPAKD
ncbi:MAG: SDR family NAD(P)-dependent oxidoreductase, partial [Cyanobacteria bacterium P01_F01_bin.33]